MRTIWIANEPFTFTTREQVEAFDRLGRIRLYLKAQLPERKNGDYFTLKFAIGIVNSARCELQRQMSPIAR